MRQWVLQASTDLSGARDEFVVDRFKVRLEGSVLTVEALNRGACFEASARELAERYTASLRSHIPTAIHLFSWEQLALQPAEAVTVYGLSETEHRRVSAALRQARRELLGSRSPSLAQCYDYFQDAAEDEQNSLPHLHKLVETIGACFSGVSKAKTSLKVKEKIDLIMGLANEPQRDERHAPRPGSVSPVSNSDRQLALDAAREILRAFERYLTQ